MLRDKIERIGKQVAAEVEAEHDDVRVSFSVTESVSGDLKLSVWVSSVSDDREQVYDFAPPAPFYNYDEARMTAEIKAKLTDYVRKFARRRR
ncbi:MAG: hypothetical protein HZC41_09420 [Chloroflexi bacterium]|nr:hypothetical protein [Chloroflexota bacterium]